MPDPDQLRPKAGAPSGTSPLDPEEGQRRGEAMQRLQAKVAALGPVEPWTAEVAYRNGLEEVTLRALGRGASPAELGAMLIAMGEVLRAGPETPAGDGYDLVQRAVAAAKAALPEHPALPKPGEE